MIYKPSKLPMANGGTDTPTFPETTTVTDTNYTVPFAPGNLYRQVTVTVKPTNSAGKAVIQSRPTNTDTWADLTEMDMTDGKTKSENLTMPSGQIRVQNSGNTGIVVTVEGVLNR